jgi:hypothetical protein
VKFAALGFMILTTALAVSVSGCGRASASIERTVTAAGVLTHGGKPLAHYQVMFSPDDARRPAAGVTDEQGKFVLGTNRLGDGAPPGKHRISVVYVGPPAAGGDGQNNFAPPPPPKVKLAAKYGNAETSGLTAEIPTSGSSDLKVEVP